jgi:acyl dehydratase
VPLNRDFEGRTFEPTPAYEVSRVKIAEFADAIGEPSPLCRDKAAAQAAGYPDVIAPPTFAIVISMQGSAKVTFDPELGLNYAMVVHGEQSFDHKRPLRPGDTVVTQSTIESIKQTGSLSMMTTRTDVRTTDGELVCVAKSVLVERGA